jgi:tetratricopeptide (TPR) repeat protein
MSQKGKVTSALSYIDQGQLDKAKEAIDQALVNESSANWPNTFFAKGRLAQSSWESDNPKFKEFYPDPLAEAYAAYEKAMELDPKGQIKKKIITNMTYSALASDLYNQGSTQFEAKDFKGALKSFEIQITISEGDKYIGSIDTGMYYNAGLAAVNSGDQKSAIKYFQKCAEMKYLGITPYYQIYESYMGMGDTVKAEATLKQLPTLFPDDKTITLQLIDLYIKSGKNAEAQKYIDIAKAADPTNYTLFFAAGIIYLNEENYDAAIIELQKSIDLNPEVFDTQYGLGAAYINKAAEMFKAANEIMDVKKYSEAVDKANAVYAKALPYMEKAYQLNPNDTYTMQSLQELYYRMKKTDKYNEIKAKLDAAQGK